MLLPVKTLPLYNPVCPQSSTGGTMDLLATSTWNSCSQGSQDVKTLRSTLLRSGSLPTEFLLRDMERRPQATGFISGVWRIACLWCWESITTLQSWLLMSHHQGMGQILGRPFGRAALLGTETRTYLAWFWLSTWTARMKIVHHQGDKTHQDMPNQMRNRRHLSHPASPWYVVLKYHLHHGWKRPTTVSLLRYKFTTWVSEILHVQKILSPGEDFKTLNG